MSTIEELQIAKKYLEIEIETLIEQFINKHNVNIEHIDFDRFDITAMGSHKKEVAVSVKVKISL